MIQNGFLIGFGLLVYAQSLFFGLTFLDDNVLIVDAFPIFNNLTNISRAFTQDLLTLVSGGFYYRPIQIVSFIINAKIGGTSPFVFHLTNLFLHIFVALLLFRLLTKLGYPKGLSLGASLIFTIHPVLSQAVIWIPGRNDPLLAIFILLSFLSFLNFLQTQKWKTYLTHLLFFALALFTKELAVILPVLCLFYLHFIARDKLFSLNKLLFLTGWGVLVATWFFARQQALSDSATYAFTEVLRSLWLNMSALVVFLGKFFFPFNLSTYPILENSSLLYGMLATLVLVFLLLLTPQKSYRYVLLGLFWFLLFLLPSFIRPESAVTTDFLEHRLYLPSIGLLLVLLEIASVKKLETNNLAFLIPFLILILVLASITMTYGRNFKNGSSYWQQAVSTSPSSAFAHKQLGAMYYLDGKLEQALMEYQKALALNPVESLVHNNLGLIYISQARVKEAEIEYQKELAINPNYDNAHFNLGTLYYQQDKFREAETMWQQTLQLNPNFIAAHNNLAIYYFQQKNFQKARYHVEEVLKRGGEVPSQLLRALDLFGN